MPFIVSGNVAGGANDALQEVLERRLKEATRQQIERQNAIENQMRQQGIDLQRESAAALEKEREADRAYRTGQTERADAESVYSRTAPGEISPEIAEALKKSPTIAPLIGQQKILEGVRPIAGTAPLDTSGPQQINVLKATPEQAEKQLKTVELKRISGVLRNAQNEKERRGAAADAMGFGLSVPANLVGQTGEEETAQKLADERRRQTEWDRQNRITFGQALHQQGIGESNMRERAEITRDEKPATNAQTTLAGYAARLEQAEPTLTKLEDPISKMNPASYEWQKWLDKPWGQSPEIQQYMQSSRNLINAVLRRESGAVVTPTEFAEAQEQYLPVPGNDPATLEQKRQNRLLNMEMYKRGAGRAYVSVADALNAPGGGITVKPGGAPPAGGKKKETAAEKIKRLGGG